MVTYVLDANIIIRLWKDAPDVLDLIERHADSDYVVTNETVVELANGEVEEFFPKMATKYQKLVKHMSNADGAGAGGRTKTPFLVKEIDGQPRALVGNRISMVDFSTIAFCQNRPACVLVTDDKKMLKNAARVLERDHVLSYDDFLMHLAARGVIDPEPNHRVQSDAAVEGEGEVGGEE